MSGETVNNNVGEAAGVNDNPAKSLEDMAGKFDPEQAAELAAADKKEVETPQAETKAEVVEDERAIQEKKLKEALSGLERELDYEGGYFDSLEDFAKTLIKDAKLDPSYVIDNYGKISDAVRDNKKGIGPDADKKENPEGKSNRRLLREELQEHMLSSDELSQEKIEESMQTLDRIYEERVHPKPAPVPQKKGLFSFFRRNK